MRDIGRRLGVSAVTVSKALSGKSGVSEDTRRKIQETAAQMGYVPPSVARAQVTRGLNIGILIPDHFFGPDSFYAAFYKHLVQVLSGGGHFGVLELLAPDMEQALTLPNVVRSGWADALILLGQPSHEYTRFIARQQVPVVFLDFYDEAASADAVVGDNAYGCYRLTSHLIKRGHTRIGFVGNRRATSSIMDRYLGFYRAMLTYDLPLREEWMIPDRDDNGRMIPLSLPQMLPTALVCNCDMVARRVITHLQSMGLRVPEDVSVVGFDDFSSGEADVPPLSTFRLDMEAMAQMAVKLCCERVLGVQRPFGRVVVGGQPVYRASDLPLRS